MTDKYEIDIEVREGFGAQPSPPDMRDYRVMATTEEFPAEFSLSYMPPVKNQGSVGSCVAHSICTCAEYYAKIQHDIEADLSVGYIYGNRIIPQITEPGMVTRFAISTFCAHGTPYLSTFPIHCEVPEVIKAVNAERTEAMEEEAAAFRFTAYARLNNAKEIKTALMAGCPIVFAMYWYKGAKVEDGILKFTTKESTGAHAMVIYGWNEKGWLIRNSWGPLWGKGGNATLPFHTDFTEAYAVFDKDATPLTIKKPFKANSDFGRFLVRAANRIYALIYGLFYRVKA